MKVIHSYEKKNLRKLRRNEEADCTKCYFAEKTPDIEGGCAWLCHAALHDTEYEAMLAWNTRAPILSSREMEMLDEH